MLWKFDCSNNLHMRPRTKDVGSRMYFSLNVIKMEKHWPNDQLLSNFLISMPFLKIDLFISSCRWRAATASLFALRLYGQNHDPLGSWGGFWSVDREGQCCACRSTEPTHIYNKWIQSFLIVSTGFVHTSTETRTPTSSVYFGQFSFQLLVTWSGAWTPPPPCTLRPQYPFSCCQCPCVSFHSPWHWSVRNRSDRQWWRGAEPSTVSLAKPVLSSPHPPFYYLLTLSPPFLTAHSLTHPTRDGEAAGGRCAIASDCSTFPIFFFLIISLSFWLFTPTFHNVLLPFFFYPLLTSSLASFSSSPLHLVSLVPKQLLLC